MSIQDLFVKLRKLNGLDVQVRINDAKMNGTMIRAEQVGSAAHPQARAEFQFPDLDIEVYRKLQKMAGDPVHVRIGPITTELLLDAISVLPTDKRFEQAKEQPFSLTFSEIQKEASVSSIQALVSDLREAGFGSIADQVALTHIRTAARGHERMMQAVEMLKAKHKYATAERLNNVRIKLYGELAPGELQDDGLIGLLRHVIDQHAAQTGAQIQISEEALQNVLGQMRDQLKATIHSLFDPAALAPADAGEVMVEPECPDDFVGVDEASFTGRESPYKRSPQTVEYDPQAPMPQKIL